MHTKPPIEPSGSPVPGVIPEPSYVHHDGDRGDGRHSATVAANDIADLAPSARRRNPARKVLAKLVGALRGDKYMTNAYPPQWHSAADTGDLRQNHNGNLPAAAPAVENPDSRPAHATPSARSQIKER